MWIPRSRSKTQHSFVKPSDPWFVNVDDLTLVHAIRSCNDVTIYDATWRKYQRVCVKRVQSTPNNEDLIQREFDILSMCAHPSVCQFLGVGQDTPYVYFVFEFMDNGNLEDYVYSRLLSRQQKIDILLDVARGLQYLSSRQPLRIIHRDFKPSNILINKHGEAKISDFGISKYLKGGVLSTMYECSVNTASGVVGTVRWTAPEVLCDNMYNHMCDIFSFGLVAYFVWTDGDVPYHSEYKNHGAKITFAKSNNVRPFLCNVEQDDSMHALIKECTENNIFLRPPNALSIVDRLLKIRASETSESTRAHNHEFDRCHRDLRCPRKHTGPPRRTEVDPRARNPVP